MKLKQTSNIMMDQKLMKIMINNYFIWTIDVI